MRPCGELDYHLVINWFLVVRTSMFEKNLRAVPKRATPWQLPAVHRHNEALLNTTPRDLIITTSHDVTVCFPTSHPMRRADELSSLCAQNAQSDLLSPDDTNSSYRSTGNSDWLSPPGKTHDSTGSNIRFQECLAIRSRRIRALAKISCLTCEFTEQAAKR